MGVSSLEVTHIPVLLSTLPCPIILLHLLPHLHHLLARFPHLLNAFVNIFRFVLEDESDVVVRPVIPAIQKFVYRSLQEMEA